MKSKFYFRIILGALFIYFIDKPNAQTPEWLWASSISGDIYNDFRSAIAVDPTNGDIFTIGRFSGNVDFDPGGGTFYLTFESDSGFDIFISKSDGVGHFLWVRFWVGSVPHCSPYHGCFVNYLMAVDPGGSGDI